MSPKGSDAPRWVAFAFLRSAIAKATRFTFHACTALNRISGKVSTETWAGCERAWNPHPWGASRCMDSAVACHFGDNWSALREQRLSARELSELLVGEEECARTRLSEESLSLTSLHAIGGGGPPILMWRFNPRLHPDIFWIDLDSGVFLLYLTSKSKISHSGVSCIWPVPIYSQLKKLKK